MEALISICSCKIHLPNSSTSTRIIAKNINVKFYYIRKGFIIWMQYSMTKASEITVTISCTCSPELSHDLHKLLDRTDSHFNFKFNPFFIIETSATTSAIIGIFTMDLHPSNSDISPTSDILLFFNQ